MFYETLLQSLADLSIHHSTIEYQASTITFQTLDEHLHLLETYCCWTLSHTRRLLIKVPSILWDITE